MSETANVWAFVIGAYAVTWVVLIGYAARLWVLQRRAKRAVLGSGGDA